LKSAQCPVVTDEQQVRACKRNTCSSTSKLIASRRHAQVVCEAQQSPSGSTCNRQKFYYTDHLLGGGDIVFTPWPGEPYHPVCMALL